jgi:hypothetical protein
MQGGMKMAHEVSRPLLFSFLGVFFFVLTAPASAQPEWLTFNSSDVNESLDPSFTVLYPSNFTNKKQQSSPLVQTFELIDLINSSTVTLNIVSGSSFSNDIMQFLAKDGYTSYWNDQGKLFASLTHGKLDGIEPLTFKGHPVADIYVTSISQGQDNISKKFLSVKRSILTNGNHNILLSCSFDAPVQAIDKQGYTSRNNPAINTYCMPFFNSLEFPDSPESQKKKSDRD